MIARGLELLNADRERVSGLRPVHVERAGLRVVVARQLDFRRQLIRLRHRAVVAVLRPRHDPRAGRDVLHGRDAAEGVLELLVLRHVAQDGAAAARGIGRKRHRARSRRRGRARPAEVRPGGVDSAPVNRDEESVTSRPRGSFLQLVHEHHPELFGLGRRKVGHERARPDFLGLRHDPDIGGARGGAHGEREGDSDFHVRSPVATHSAENPPPAQRRSARGGVAQERAGEPREVAPVRQRRDRLAAPRPDRDAKPGTVCRRSALCRVRESREARSGRSSQGGDFQRTTRFRAGGSSGRREGRRRSTERRGRSAGSTFRFSTTGTRGAPGPRRWRDFRRPAPAFPPPRGRPGSGARSRGGRAATRTPASFASPCLP